MHRMRGSSCCLQQSTCVLQSCLEVQARAGLMHAYADLGRSLQQLGERRSVIYILALQQHRQQACGGTPAANLPQLHGSDRRRA